MTSGHILRSWCCCDPMLNLMGTRPGESPAPDNEFIKFHQASSRNAIHEASGPPAELPDIIIEVVKQDPEDYAGTTQSSTYFFFIQQHGVYCDLTESTFLHWLQSFPTRYGRIPTPRYRRYESESNGRMVEGDGTCGVHGVRYNIRVWDMKTPGNGKRA